MPSPTHQTLSNYLKQAQQVIESRLGPAWVSAEVAEAKQHQGHLYLSLVDHNPQGDKTANCRAMIWRSQLRPLMEKFASVTGAPIKADVKVLLKVKPRFDPRFGFSLNITDIDPTYTLGDVAQRIAAIRKALIESGRYANQKQLQHPVEFCRVAVLSPDNAAGLGDFRREADQLAQLALTQFDYFHACFQGPGTANSLVQALRKIFAQNRHRHYDCIVIIRGGGAVTDLNYLNELTIAQAMTHFPTPIFTGIGHQKDQTILDEIAFRCFDTPSKVIAHIKHHIERNALQAERHLQHIHSSTQHPLQQWHHPIALASQQLRSGPALIFKTQEHSTKQHFLQIEHLAKLACANAHKFIGKVLAFNLQQSQTLMHQTQTRQAQLSQQIYQQSQRSIEYTKDCVSRTHQLIENNTNQLLHTSLLRINACISQLPTHSQQVLRGALETLGHNARYIHSTSDHIIQKTLMEIDHNYKIAELSGPEKTLKRGFGILRDNKWRPIKDCSQAKDQATGAVTLELRDGALPLRLQSTEAPQATKSSGAKKKRKQSAKSKRKATKKPIQKNTAPEEA